MTVALHGDIRANHCKIGEWWAVCQPGKNGIHPYSREQHGDLPVNVG